MAFRPQDLAAAYALNVIPRLQIPTSTRLELYPDRPFRAYRVFTVKPARLSPQLSLFPDHGPIYVRRKNRVNAFLSTRRHTRI